MEADYSGSALSAALPYIAHAPPQAEVLEEVAVRHCWRRGRAIDLVLDRARENRSQFVFTEPHRHREGGRPMIFWQTARAATAGERRP